MYLINIKKKNKNPKIYRKIARQLPYLDNHQNKNNSYSNDYYYYKQDSNTGFHRFPQFSGSQCQHLLANFLVTPRVALQSFSSDADASRSGDYEISAVAALDLRLRSDARGHGLRAEPALGAVVRPVLQDGLRGGALGTLGRIADGRQVADFEFEGAAPDARLVVWFGFSSNGKSETKNL